MLNKASKNCQLFSKFRQIWSPWRQSKARGDEEASAKSKPKFGLARVRLTAIETHFSKGSENSLNWLSLMTHSFWIKSRIRTGSTLYHGDGKGWREGGFVQKASSTPPLTVPPSSDPIVQTKIYVMLVLSTMIGWKLLDQPIRTRKMSVA